MPRRGLEAGSLVQIEMVSQITLARGQVAETMSGHENAKRTCSVVDSRVLMEMRVKGFQRGYYSQNDCGIVETLISGTEISQSYQIWP